MKRESLNIIKYLLVYGFLLVAPVTIIAVIEVVSNRLQGVTMSDDELWATPYMTTGLVLAFVIWWFHRKYPTQEMKTNE